MPHIHENGNDFVVDVYVVHKNRVLLRLHDKHNKWLVPGGHIELDETPEEAARREVKEEVGLDIVLWDPRAHKVGSSKGYQDIIPPVHMNMHEINERHKHISHIYFATTVSDETAEQENEKRDRKSTRLNSSHSS